MTSPTGAKMADAEHQTAVMLDHVDENQLTVNSEMERPLMAVAEENVMEGETVNEDILQQALEVASPKFRSNCSVHNGRRHHRRCSRRQYYCRGLDPLRT